MAHLIDKDALVAEIDRQIELLKPFLGACAGQIVAEANDKLSVLEELKNFFDTLEVKEVDLGAELNKWRHNHFHGRRDKEASGEYLKRVSQLELAKHFFELGLKAQKGKEV